MTYLITEILVYLLIAGVLGLLLGWLIWGWGKADSLRAARDEGREAGEAAAALRNGRGGNGAETARLKAEIETGETARAELQRQLEEAESARDALSSQRVRLEDRIEKLERELADCHAGAAAQPDPAPAAPEPLVAAPLSAPATLLSERPEEVDDLKQIKGVGPVMERVLNDKGVYLFRQLATFSAEDVAWVNEAIEAFPGRIERDAWVAQAQALYREKYGKGHDED